MTSARLAGVAISSLALGAMPAAGSVDRQATGTIRGVVVDDRGNPVPQARVGVAAGERYEGFLRTTMADAAGCFEFRDLTPGIYTLALSKDGYANTAFGQVLSGSSAMAIPLAADQRREIRARLPRAGVIAGIVTDETGAPQAGAGTYAAQWIRTNGRRYLRRVRSALTNSRGEFRLHGLAPGRYIVSASRAFRSHGRLTRAGEPDEYLMLPRVFYPKTSDVKLAEAVAVAPDEEVHGIDFRLVPQPAGSIVVTVDGLTALSIRSTEVRAVAAGDDQDMDGSRRTAEATPDGRYVLEGVPPGAVTVLARGFVRGGVRGQSPPPLWGATEIVATAGQNTTTVTLQMGATIAGRFERDPATATPDYRLLDVRLMPIGGAFESMSQGSPERRPLPGSFEISGFPPGRHRLTIPNLPVRWSLLSAVADGHDLLDDGLAVDFGQRIDSLVVTLTDRHTSIEGRVTSRDGEAAYLTPVVIFPVDPRRRTELSRWIALAQPDIDGRYDMSGLPEGDYFVTAAPIDFDPALEPDRLAAFEPGARRVRLTFDAPVTQNLQVVNGGGEAVFPER